MSHESSQSKTLNQPSKLVLWLLRTKYARLILQIPTLSPHLSLPPACSQHHNSSLPTSLPLPYRSFSSLTPSSPLQFSLSTSDSLPLPPSSFMILFSVQVCDDLPRPQPHLQGPATDRVQRLQLQNTGHQRCWGGAFFRYTHLLHHQVCAPCP